MKEPILQVSDRRFCLLRGAPRYGRQHLGEPPGGAQDRWSLACGNLLLGNPPLAAGLEMCLAPPTLHFLHEALVVFSGAPAAISCGAASLPMQTVLRLPAGSVVRLRLGPVGLRTYCCVAGGLHEVGGGFGLATAPAAAVVGRQRPAWGDLAAWAAPRGWLRIRPGPEWDPGLAEGIQGPWRVDARADDSGLHLQGPRLRLPDYDIWSGPLADGVIQLAAGGPMLLLRGRRTMGGYPRIACLLEPDVDLAAQLRPGAAIRLMLVDAADAAEAAAQQAAVLARLASVSVAGP